ncbi:MAG: hypothetical protein VZR95_09490 [Alphaproteobacteria bacterium]
MREQFIALLQTFGLPIFLQGSLNKDSAYPSSFFTYWNDTTEDNAHYDNDTIAFNWQFTIYYYTQNENAAQMDGVFLQIRNLFKQNGWIMTGVGYDVPSDEPTHVGRAIDVYYIQQNNKEANKG